MRHWVDAAVVPIAPLTRDPVLRGYVSGVKQRTNVEVCLTQPPQIHTARRTIRAASLA